jgi:hypothetical protein
MDENTPDNRLQERFIRWQQALRDSLSSHVALIVALASAGVGIAASILNAEHAVFAPLTSWLLLAAGTFFLVSLLLALFISLNRLHDTRATLEILKRRRERAPADVIRQLQDRADALGKRTWGAAYWQVGIFAAATVCLAAGVFFAFRPRLFSLPEHSAQSTGK